MAAGSSSSGEESSVEMRHYCDLSLVLSSMKSFTKKQKQFVENLDFGDLWRILNSDHEDLNSRLDILIKGFDPSKVELQLPDGPKIDLRTQIRNLLPVPCGPYKFKCHRIIKREQSYKKKLFSYVNQRYGFDPRPYEKKISIFQLWLELARAGDSMNEGEFCIKFSLAFAGTFLAPVGNKKVNLDILSDLVPFERIKTLDWGDFLIDQLASAVQSRTDEHFKGCVYLLHRADVVYRQRGDLNSPAFGSPSVGNGGPFSGRTAVYHPERMHSSRQTDLHILVAELKHRRDCLKDIMDLIGESPRLAGEQAAQESENYVKLVDPMVEPQGDVTVLEVVNRKPQGDVSYPISFF